MRPNRNGSRYGGGVGAFINPSNPNIPLTRVYERRTARGRRYLVGPIGIAKILIVESDEVGDGDKVWQVFLAQGSSQRRRVGEGPALHCYSGNGRGPRAVWRRGVCYSSSIARALAQRSRSFRSSVRTVRLAKPRT